jgi:hypothetical protein
MILKIQVTADDIAKGHVNDGCYCPIARACHRVFPSLPELVVGRWDVFADAGDSDARIGQLPPEAVEFIEKFDQYRAVEPFEFELDVPDDRAKEASNA